MEIFKTGVPSVARKTVSSIQTVSVKAPGETG